MLTESHDEEQIIARVAALDIGKTEVVCCVRVPGGAETKKRLQEVSTHSTMTRALAELANHLVDLGVQRVVMEATSDHWKPVFYLLEARGLDPWLVNARDVKHLPGRPKTDALDAVWLCKVAERQMLRPQFRAPQTGPAVAGSDPLPHRSARRPHRREEPGRKTPGRRLHQTLRRGLRHFRGLRAGDDGRPDRRGARPHGARPVGAGEDAGQDRPFGGGVYRALR